MVRAQQSADDRIVVLRPGRVGRGAALNIGLDAAKADLIGVQDADDASHVERLATQLEVFRHNPNLSLLGTGAKVSRGLTERADWKISTARPRVHPVDLALLRSNPIIHSSVLARSRALARVGGYDARRVAQLDYDLLLRLRARGEIIGVCDRPLVLHRRHPGQTYEGMSPSSRAWSSYRLQTSHVANLPPVARVGYHGVAATRLIYQVARGMAWHRASRHQRAAHPSVRAGEFDDSEFDDSGLDDSGLDDTGFSEGGPEMVNGSA
jgi:glycosyltransferase involved in cell wall biosynthesis